MSINVCLACVIFSISCYLCDSFSCVFQVYFSEFGKQRLAEEDLNGPKELADEIEEDQEEEGDPNNVEVNFVIVK